jgi:hypothetical protein
MCNPIFSQCYNSSYMSMFALPEKRVCRVYYLGHSAKAKSFFAECYTKNFHRQNKNTRQINSLPSAGKKHLAKMRVCRVFFFDTRQRNIQVIEKN